MHKRFKRAAMEVVDGGVDGIASTGDVLSLLLAVATEIQALLGLPVFRTVSLLNWFHAGLRPRRF